ncbi:MAG: hypothetical protein OXR73_23970, partial [Myxococcales bacterium]|nr:hypothetical protein [Myxococcales bacterium]
PAPTLVRRAPTPLPSHAVWACYPWACASASRLVAIHSMSSQKKSGLRPIPWVGALAWLLGLLVGVPGAVRAEDWISWNAPAECPADDEMEAHVRDLVGTDVKPTTMAHIVIDRQVAGYRARIQLANAAGVGRRVLYDAQCADLANAAALVVALGVTVQPRKTTEPLRWSAAARAGAVFGLLPAPALTAGLSVSLQGPVELEAHGDYFVPQTKQLEDGIVGGRMWLIGAGIRLGLPLGGDQLQWSPRVGVDVYRLTAEGRGGTESFTVGNTMWGPAGGLSLRWQPLDHFGVVLVAEGVLPLRRARVVFTDTGPLHQPSILAFRLLMAIEARP